MITEKKEIKEIFDKILKIFKLQNEKKLKTHFVNLDEIENFDFTQSESIFENHIDEIICEDIDKIFIYEQFDTFQDTRFVLFFKVKNQYFYLQINQQFAKMYKEDYVKVQSTNPITIINYIKQKNNFENSFLDNLIKKEFTE